jgi:hypothetical protein
MNITVNLPLQIGHAPAPVYQKQPNGEDNFQAGSKSKVETVIWFDDVTGIYLKTSNDDIILIHSPLPVYQKQPNGEDNFQTGSESKVVIVIWDDDVINIYSTKLNYEVNSIHLLYFMYSFPAPVYQKQPNGKDNLQTGSVIKSVYVIWFVDVISIYLKHPMMTSSLFIPQHLYIRNSPMERKISKQVL